MSAIPSLNGSVHGPNAQDPRVAGRHAAPRLSPQAFTDAAAQTDSVELSTQAIAQSLKFEAPARSELIARIKAQIADGTYNEDDKVAIAADRLARELNK